jgi:TPR repeat protein
LGLCALHGGGVAQSDVEVVEWFRKTADQGLAKGQSNLALLYQDGKGVPQDLQIAADLLRAAADREYARAQYKLGILSLQ